jgi:hypothetical protein
MLGMGKLMLPQPKLNFATVGREHPDLHAVRLLPGHKAEVLQAISGFPGMLTKV